MRIIIDDIPELGRFAVDLIAEQISYRPDCTIGLATGSSPLPIYHELAARVDHLVVAELRPGAREVPAEEFAIEVHGLLQVSGAEVEPCGGSSGDGHRSPWGAGQVVPMIRSAIRWRRARHWVWNLYL